MAAICDDLKLLWRQRVSTGVDFLFYEVLNEAGSFTNHLRYCFGHVS